jgi:ribonucleoside-diphosphate reductase alpha chain
MTGIASGKVLELDMKEAATVVKVENARVADLIGIKPAARSTTVKPEGTASCILGTSSGIHAWHAPFYIRRLRVGKDESIYKHLSVYHPELIEDDVMVSNQAVISIPQRSPHNAITRQESALELLSRVSTVSNEWVAVGHRRGQNKNNVSTTVTIKPNEWEEVGEWMWDNRNLYTALSVLPYSDHTYVQAPFEDCTEETYDTMMHTLRDIDLSKVIELDDNTKLSEEVACGGGGCEIT